MELTQSDGKRSLLLFALPIIVSLLCEQLYNIVDTIIVGRFLGVDELAAVGNAGSIIGVLLVVAGGMEMGCEVVFAKYAKQSKEKSFHQLILSIFLFCVVAAISFSAIGILGRDIITTYMQIPNEILPYLHPYYMIYVGGIIFVFLYAVSRAILLAMGNSKLCMHLVIFTSCINIVLDLLLICVFPLGVAGAAIATIIAQAIGMMVAMSTLLHKCSFHMIPLSFTLFIQRMKEILGIALPSMVQQFVLTLGMLLLMSIVNPFGTQVISGYVCAEKIMMMALLPVVGFSISISMFGSANADDKAKVTTGFWYLSKIALVYITLVAIVMMLFPKPIISLFIDVNLNEHAYVFARTYLCFSIFNYYLASMKYMNEGLLRGYAKMRQFLISNIGDFILRLAFTYVFVSLLQEHIFWVATLVGRVFAVVISFYLLYHLQLLTKQGLLKK